MSPDTDALRSTLETATSVALAVLFGSCARNTSRAASDLDLGVLIDPPALERFEPGMLALALERATLRSVDLVVLNDAPPLLRFEVARDGHLLLERQPHAWADFRAQAMVDWWDWAPTARMFASAAAARLRHAAAPGGSDGAP